LREVFDDQRGMALALLGLGRVALRERRHADARTLFERGLAILRQVGAQVDTGFALDGLAAVAVATDEYEEARRCLAEALQLALATGSQPLLLWVLLGAAQLLLPTEKAAWGPEAVMLVLNHPACDHEMRDHAHRLLNQYERMLAPSVFAAATHRGQHGTLRLFTAQLEAILELPVEIIAPATLPGDLVGASATVPPLIEPLTEREQEVMQLLAEGLSNQEIADRLIVAIGTVKWYTRQIYGKLGVQSRTQAIAHARHLNLLT
jgi:DNA-binding CsgD family transcriptional regulator